ncbi:sortase [Mediterraneibacter faecis]|uniref:sortase n=1 Tax=Mediterraneibacter faecis TaxID=592978 RepID=UPI000E4E9878|nr:sortase [Mediterraneibacter faecis]RGI29280.1 sortase [Ruminococcus sp. OM08-13AT]RGI56001.1 sortase [Ruminococcus sp. OF05-2BH]
MSKKKKNWIGKIFTITGLLLFAAALALSVYNLWDGYRAEQSREKLLEEYRDKNQNISDEGEQAEESDGQIPDYQLNPEMEMPEVRLEELDGAACIGVLEIPEIDLKLPVLSEWSYPLLKKAPCRYSGSAYLDNLVIAAHNYRTHFGKLKELEVGTEVIFTDAAENRFEYKVAAVEALTPQSVEDMTSGEWALSLFTCTLDGKNRVTVRCDFTVLP